MITIRSAWRPGALVALALLAASPALAVRTTLGTASGLAGQTVLVNLTTTALDGFNVRSFQFDFTYNPSVVTATAVVESSTIVSAAGWGDATVSITSGRVSVSHAGSAPLSGSGTLCVLRFVINPALLQGSGTGLNFGSFLFNEGAPADTTFNGSINVNPTPVITVSPGSGEIIRGQTIQFSVSGSVTLPVTWNVTDPTVATISSSGLLTGVAPGSTRVFAVDAATRRDTTDGVVLVRGMGITSGTASVLPGQVFDVPITVTSLNGLGVRSGQFSLNWNGALFSVTAVNVPTNALLYHYGPVGTSILPGRCDVDFAGITDLTGAGTLFVLHCLASNTVTGGTQLAIGSALFNETLIAKPTSGSVTVNALPTLSISPDAITLLAGQTQTFTLSGPAVAPITWSTLDPSVAIIDATGKLTAVAGGVTRVRADDAVGNFDLNSSVTVYDYKLTVSSVVGPPGSTVRVELKSDRDLGPLGIYSAQYSLAAPSAYVTQVRSMPGGLIGGWPTGTLVANPGTNTLAVAAAGSSPLGAGTTLHVVNVVLSPSTPLGTFVPLNLSNLICNEGRPFAQVVNGGISVLATSGLPLQDGLSFALDPPDPNPSRGPTRIRFVVPQSDGEGGRVRLAIYGIDGRVVRTLVDASWPAGAHEVRWDALGDHGESVSAGVYFLRLDWAGRRLTRRLALLR